MNRYTNGATPVEPRRENCGMAQPGAPHTDRQGCPPPGGARPMYGDAPPSYGGRQPGPQGAPWQAPPPYPPPRPPQGQYTQPHTQYGAPPEKVFSKKLIIILIAAIAGPIIAFAIVSASLYREVGRFVQNFADPPPAIWEEFPEEPTPGSGDWPDYDFPGSGSLGTDMGGEDSDAGSPPRISRGGTDNPL